MKNLLKCGILLLAVMLLATPAMGQWSSKTVQASKSYANSQIDTVTMGGTFGQYNKLVLAMRFGDSVKVQYILDTRVRGESSWTAADDSVTFSNTGTGTSYQERVLRDNTAELVAGMATEFRFRFLFSAYSPHNGVTTPTYDATLRFR